MATEYVFISDLHVGGDEQLTTLDCKDELLAFLESLEERGGDVELIINGDAFGLWEYTEVTGLEKFDALVADHPDLFEQFRATGEVIDVTLIPGNHDYDLACYPAYVDLLAEYNITLEPETVITREVAGATVWIEHGQQHDSNNRMRDWGNPHALPVGYFVVQRIVGAAGRYSGQAKGDWLRDIQSVAPMEELPRWLLSNYFYREMSPVLRAVLVPLLIFFNLSLLYLFGIVLEDVGILPTRFFLGNDLIHALGIAGIVIEVIVAINIAIATVLALVLIPMLIFRRDFRRMLGRFGVTLSGVRVGQGDEPFLNAARDVFETHPDVAVFVYGHTHRASLTRWGDRLVLNTGTWLKKLQHVSTWFSRVPGVYYPSFRLNYYRICPEGEEIVVEYEEIDTDQPRDLTLLQRLATRRPPPEKTIPARTVIDPAGSLELPASRERQSTDDADGREPSRTEGEPEPREGAD